MEAVIAKDEGHAADGSQQVPLGPDGKPLSRNQQKKLAKAQRAKEAKEAKKAAERERKAAEKERKREEAAVRNAAMTEEERAAALERRQAVRDAAAAERARHREHARAALQAPLRLVIDLDFDGLMNPSEVRSLVSQVSFSYGVATKGERQAHLHLLGARGFVKQQLRAQMPHLDSWALTLEDAGYADHFKEQLGDVVYLTADSPNELDAIDTGKIYVIGGIVDRNRHKRLCLNRAEAAGVAHARLPINKHVQLATSAVITVNQVVDILVKGQGLDTDWAAVLAEALPQRKRADGGGDGDGGGGDGDGGGDAAQGGGSSADGGEEDGAAVAAAAVAEGNGGDGPEEEEGAVGTPEQGREGGGTGGEGAGEPGAKRQRVDDAR